MPISKEALDRFVNKTFAEPIHVKEWDIEKLVDFITKISGQIEFKTNPRKNQLEGLLFALLYKRILLYYDPRTGKTKIALDWLSVLKSKKLLQKAFIIAHSPIGVDEWERQTSIHSNLKGMFIRTDKQTEDNLCKAIEEDYDFCVVAWSTLQVLFTKKIYKTLVADKELIFDVVAQCFNTIIIDEIHMVMNPRTLRFEIAEQLVQNCEYRMGLTGTPIGRNPFGLWSQAYLIDEGKALSNNYYFFKNAFGYKQYNHFARNKQVIEFDHDKFDKLQNKIKHMTLTCALSEIHDVNIINDIVSLNMGDNQLQAYRKAIKEFIEEQKKEESEGLFKQKRTNIFVKLRQISSGFENVIDANGNKSIITYFDCAKLQWVEDLITTLDQDLQIVIFHEFTESGKNLVSLMKKFKVKHGWLWGGTKDRAILQEKFRDKKIQVLIANHTVGGIGIDLSVADYMCFFENPVSSIVRKQAESRPLARGDRAIVIDDLVCSPVEKSILEYIKEGKSFLDDMMKISSSRFAGIMRGENG